LADLHVRLADALVRLGRLCEAEGQLRAARRLEPSHEGAARLTADLLLARGRLVEALECLGACAESASPLLLTEYADVLARIGLLDEAELAYGRALRSGECAETRTNLGLLMLGRGDRHAALRQFERALEVDPSAPEPAVNRANVLLELGRLDEAEALLEGLCRNGETRAPALWGLAAASELRGDPAAARRARGEAVGLWPALEQLGAPAEDSAPSDGR
jgi:tetratricopeptide (TPR) repeat protein